jgi:hypothetical protein
VLGSWFCVELPPAARALNSLINFRERRGWWSSIFNGLLLVQSISKLVALHLPLRYCFRGLLLRLFAFFQLQCLIIDYFCLKDLSFYFFSTKLSMFFKCTLIEFLSTTFRTFHKDYFFKLSRDFADFVANFCRSFLVYYL